MHALYPIFLDLAERRAVVLGGAEAAAAKVRGLLAARAVVVVVAPRLVEELDQLARHGAIEHRARRYREGDLAGAAIALATLPPHGEHLETNARFFAEARALGIPANAMDDLASSNFYAPSILRRGDLAIAVSTAGAAPALAVRLRERLERELGPEFGRFLAIARRLRPAFAARYPEFDERRRAWYALVDSGALLHLRRGEEAAAAREITASAGLAPEVVARALADEEERSKVETGGEVQAASERSAA